MDLCLNSVRLETPNTNEIFFPNYSKHLGLLKILKTTNRQTTTTKIVRRFKTLYEQKFYNLRPLLSITFPQGFQKSFKKK